MCRLLAELVRSYGFVAKVVVEHEYYAAPNNDVGEVGSAVVRGQRPG